MHAQKFVPRTRKGEKFKAMCTALSCDLKYCCNAVFNDVCNVGRDSDRRFTSLSIPFIRIGPRLEARLRKKNDSP